jgi:glycosyltransferase involved in cell wall biosynthesis
LKLLFVCNTVPFFISHRLALAIKAKELGFEVHVASVSCDEAEILEENGFDFHHLNISRSGQNLVREFCTFLSMLKLFRRIKPDIVHLITIKPVIYGGIAARLAGVTAVVSAVSGLGTVFLATSTLARIRRRFVVALYRLAFGSSRSIVIFQNPDDRKVLLDLKVVKAEQCRLIRGSGVNLATYPVCLEPDGDPIVVFAARLLRDKGVMEFVQAAAVLKNRGLSVVMRLIGSTDSGNPTSVGRKDLDEWLVQGLVEVHGHSLNIAKEYANSNIVCLPSYREGLPKSLVEAAACGRAVVTTDVPGCRDAITPGVTGLTVPVKDAVALADAIQTLILDSELRNSMGQAGRALAEEAFTIEMIVEQHMDIYRDLIEQ